MRPKKIASVALLLLLIPTTAWGSPYEAKGTVIAVIDGKTFEIMMERSDPRIIYNVERVTLADLEVPEEPLDQTLLELMNGSMNESFRGSVDEPMNGSMNVSINGSITEPMDGSMNESFRGSVDEPMNGSMNESFSGSIDEPMKGSRSGHLIGAEEEPQMEPSAEMTNGSLLETNNVTAEGSVPVGPSAKDLAVAILLNKTVWLDIDDSSEDGRNSEGELVAVLYLSGLDGSPLLSPSFNRMLVDYGIAELNDSTDNEFNPADWWPAQENVSEDNISADEAAGTKPKGLNIDIKPTKPQVEVNISRLSVNINPAKPKVNVNPTKPVVNVSPGKPAIEVEAAPPNETGNETDGAVSYYDSLEGGKETGPFSSSGGSEPLVLVNQTAPVTLINPTGTITIVNSTGEVTLIDPSLPVKVINSSEAEGGSISAVETASGMRESEAWTEGSDHPPPKAGIGRRPR